MNPKKFLKQTMKDGTTRLWHYHPVLAKRSDMVPHEEEPVVEAPAPDPAPFEGLDGPEAPAADDAKEGLRKTLQGMASKQMMADFAFKKFGLKLLPQRMTRGQIIEKILEA
jgi:hypothetical protein